MPSAWAPLRRRIFAALWSASLVSNIGTWMQNVGVGWQMTSLTTSPTMVSLVQVATTLPVFLLGLLAGSLADIVHRRRLLVLTQAWMLAMAAALALLAWRGLATPWLLLSLTFGLGIGAALNAPVWQAVIPELVPLEELPAAVALNGVSMNASRAIGPAVGGLLIAWLGPPAVYALNAASFVGVIVVLIGWRRRETESTAPPERLLSATRAGIRYARHSPPVRSVLVRGALFVVPGSAIFALAPLIARDMLSLGASGYGVLLGSLGVGAVCGAIVLPRIRGRLGSNGTVALGATLFATAMVALGLTSLASVAAAAAFISGIGWLCVLSSLNVALQTGVPMWVRARVMSFHIMVFFGSMSLGSIIWGVVAGHAGLPAALLAAGAALIPELVATPFFRLAEGRPDALESADFLPLHDSLEHPDGDDGPVAVIVEYELRPDDAAEFTKLMSEVGRRRRRDGAFAWTLTRDLSDRSRFVEMFFIESWDEHLRQHERMTRADLALFQRARAFHKHPGGPLVRHFVAVSPGSFEL